MIITALSGKLNYTNAFNIVVTLYLAMTFFKTSRILEPKIALNIKIDQLYNIHAII